MGKVLNFWKEDEAVDLFYTVYSDWTYENFIEYIEEYAPWLRKKADQLWYEANL